MGYLVGNDFIPHLPEFHIKQVSCYTIYIYCVLYRTASIDIFMYVGFVVTISFTLDKLYIYMYSVLYRTACI